MAFGEWPETIFSSAASCWTVLLAASPSWELHCVHSHNRFPVYMNPSTWATQVILVCSVKPSTLPSLSQLYLRNVFIALNTCISKGTAVKCAVSSLVLLQLFFFFRFLYLMPMFSTLSSQPPVDNLTHFCLSKYILLSSTSCLFQFLCNWVEGVLYVNDVIAMKHLANRTFRFQLPAYKLSSVYH